MPLKKTNSNSFDVSYNFWLNNLFERIMRLFKYTGMDCILPKEIEQRLLMTGHCAVKMHNGSLTAFYGEFSTPTIYYDEFEKYSVYSPKYARTLSIGEECVIINNNSIRNDCFSLCQRYATMLAHLEVTFVNSLINMRDSNGVPIAGNSKVRESLRNYRKSLVQGDVMPIFDPSLSFAKIVMPNNNKVELLDFIESRKNLLECFYNDIGVKTGFTKKGNMIQEEVNSGDSMLLFNIDDMLNARKIGCELVNKKFGTNWSVELAKGVRMGVEMNGEND